MMSEPSVNLAATYSSNEVPWTVHKSDKQTRDCLQLIVNPYGFTQDFFVLMVQYFLLE